MSSPAFIAIDWGTSNARFILADAEGGVLAEVAGCGIAVLAGSQAVEEACFEIIAPWIASHPGIPVLMAGMVGSNIGWHLVPYAKAPASAHAIIMGSIRWTSRDADFMILPGVSTTRTDGLPDVMRGEETQIIGAQLIAPILSEKTLMCLPGTHAKWAVIEAGALVQFHTAMTGELLQVLGEHSILLNPKRAPAAIVGADFMRGVEVARDGTQGLETLLFTVRSRQIEESLHTEFADSYLAGLCIGAEVRSARLLYPDFNVVTLVGSPVLMALYAEALRLFGIDTQQINGTDAVLAGLTTAYHTIFIAP